jgi:hypothetical protein
VLCKDEDELSGKRRENGRALMQGQQEVKKLSSRATTHEEKHLKSVFVAQDHQQRQPPSDSAFAADAFHPTAILIPVLRRLVSWAS